MWKAENHHNIRLDTLWAQYELQGPPQNLTPLTVKIYGQYNTYIEIQNANSKLPKCQSPQGKNVSVISYYTWVVLQGLSNKISEMGGGVLVITIVFSFRKFITKIKNTIIALLLQIPSNYCITHYNACGMCCGMNGRSPQTYEDKRVHVCV